MTDRNTNLDRILRNAGARIRGVERRRIFYGVAAALFCSLGAMVVLDHLYRLADWQRYLASTTIAAAGITAWFRRRDRLGQGRVLSELYVARRLEQANPALHNILVTALQTGAEVPRTTAFDKELEKASAVLCPAGTDPAVAVAVAVAAVLGIYGATGPQSMATSAGRLLKPWSNQAPPSYTRILAASPASGALIVTDSPWLVTVDAAGYPAESGDLHVSRDGGAWRSYPLQKKDDADRYFRELPPVTGTWAFRVRLGDALLPARTVRVLQRPVVLNVSQTLRPPAYLGRPETVLSQRPVQAVIGTELDLDFELDRNVSGATLMWCGREIILRTVGRHVRTRSPLRVEQSGGWNVRYHLEEADEWIDGDRATVTALPDALPTAELLEPAADSEVTADSLIAIRYRAIDDFQVTEPELVIRRFGSDESRRIKLPAPVLPDRLEGTWSLIPRELDAHPGDRFTVALRVRDGHPAHLPGWSEAIAITIAANEGHGRPIAADRSPVATPDGAPPEVAPVPAAPQSPEPAAVAADDKKQPAANEQPMPTAANDDKTVPADSSSAPGPDRPATKEQASAAEKPPEREGKSKPGSGDNADAAVRESNDPATNNQPQDTAEPAAAGGTDSDQKGAAPCPTCGKPAKGGTCPNCSKPGGNAPGAGETPGNDSKPGDKPGDKPGGDTPGQAPLSPSAADRPEQIQSSKPHVGGGRGDGPQGAETARRNDAAAPENETVLETPLPDNRDVTAPGAIPAGGPHQADGDATPFTPVDAAAPKADLPQPAAPPVADSAGLPTDLAQPAAAPAIRPEENFSADIPNMAQVIGEAERSKEAKPPSPGFAPVSFSADDLDLIQSFRDAANRLIRRAPGKD